MTNTDKERADFDAELKKNPANMLLSPEEERLAFDFFRAGREAERAEAVTDAKPYAHEYGADNGDGTYSVIITKGKPQRPVKDWPVTPLYAHPPKSEPSPDVKPLAKVFRAKSTSELKAMIYKAHGWKRARGESMGLRVAALYDVTADFNRNDLVATPKITRHPKPEPPADLVERAWAFWKRPDNSHRGAVACMAAFAQEHAAELHAENGRLQQALGFWTSDHDKRWVAEKARADEYKKLFEECGVARDGAGFIGTVPDCIAYLTDCVDQEKARADAAEKALADERESERAEDATGMYPDAIATALRNADWSGQSIGNKALISAAIERLSKPSPDVEALALTREACARWCETNGFEEAGPMLRKLPLPRRVKPDPAPDVEVRDLVKKLRFLVSLNETENGGPYKGHAAQECVNAMRSAADALDALTKPDNTPCKS